MIAMRILPYDTLDSTSAEAHRLLAAGIDTEPYVIVARAQTAGRGTQGRSWCSPRDAGLYMTRVERLPGGVAPAAELTRAAGVACAEVLAEVFGLRVCLRGVNDLYLGAGKLGGILVEGHAEQGRLVALATGVGLNLWPAERLLPAGAPPAAVLADQIDADLLRQVRRETLALRLAERIGHWQRQVLQGAGERVRDAWERHGQALVNLPASGAVGLNVERVCASRRLLPRRASVSRRGAPPWNACDP